MPQIQTDITVVIPTIREDCIIRWLDEWRNEFAGVRVIVVEDNPEPTFRISGVEHYAWDSIDRELGKDSWIIPRRADGVCSYGFLKALQSGADIIWNLNDDCYPEEAHRGSYVRQLKGIFASAVGSTRWYNTMDFSDSGLFARGYPYEARRPVALHHGLWSNIPDLDGETQLANPDFRLPPCEGRDVVPAWKFFPMCNMNIAFRADFTPALYQLLMGQDKEGNPWGFDRFSDIWSGLFMKRIADHLGYGVTTGAPGIHHDRASDPHKNVLREAAGKIVHERFWEYIQDTWLDGSDPAACYLEIADAVDDYRGETPRKDYWHSLAAAMRLWVKWSSG